MQHGFSPWSRKIPWRSKWQPTPVFLPGKFHGQTGLAGYSPGGCKSQTQLNDFTIQEHGLTLNLSSYLERWVLSSCSLSTTSQTPSMPWSGILTCDWCPSFYIQWPGFCSYCTRNHPQLPGSRGWRWVGLYVVPKVH